MAVNHWVGRGEMAHQRKLIIQGCMSLEGLSLILVTHWKVGENWLHKIVHWLLHVCYGMQIHKQKRDYIFFNGKVSGSK